MSVINTQTVYCDRCRAIMATRTAHAHYTVKDVNSAKKPQIYTIYISFRGSSGSNTDICDKCKKELATKALSQ